MDPVFKQLLILMVVVWSVAVMLRRIGLPTIMGELVMGVILGPAVLGWVQPSEIIEILAQLGIFFLMLHAGVETKPREFFEALRASMGIAVVGAMVPFSVSMAVGLAFGLSIFSALFVGLTMTATAVVITIKILQDIGLQNTRMARVVVASCVIDAILTLVLFSVVLGIVKGGSLDPLSMLWIGLKSILFFGVVIAIGYYLYPLLKHPFRNREGKGFTFVLILGLGFGLFAEAIGLHIILGAYLAGLFFSEEVASPGLAQKVEDRLYGIAFSFLGPIFFISLGFHITFDFLTTSGIWFIVILTFACIAGQIISAGGMAKLLRFSWIESLTVGVGMCGRAEMAFILASLGLSMGAIDTKVFSILIFTTFILNMITPAGLKGCATLLKRGA
ncbi:MAG: cation:proton antiporter [Planctomycetota bacterium]|jgi:Kef-type K+ transport system membrane component KefB